MTDEPIVFARRHRDKTISLICPHCRRRHHHGDDGRVLCHRLSHCADMHLPRRLRGNHHMLAYHIVVLSGTGLQKADVHALFAQMDEIAADARTDPLHVVEDEQIAFRALQKFRHAKLDRQQWLDMFRAWRVHDAARRRDQREQQTQRAHAIARKNPGGAFVCVCGATIDPFDPAMEALHRPHVFVAGLDKVKRASWRNNR